MQCMGTNYEGCSLNGRMDDPEAIYKFPNHFGSEYHGGIVDGMFHGEGKLKVREGVHFTGKFEKGRAVEGFFEFQDDVRFEIENWAYCDGDNNRVFKSELENGLKPAGRSQLTNVDPPQTIPKGMYDCGDGFYDPVVRTVINYDSVFLRNTDEKEHQWIINRCRKAWDEPVGTRKLH
nr:MORN repeat-containing protein 5-like [Pocillopora verrucosa]